MASAIIGGGRERKGTMFLRSNEMHYGRAVLNSNWHQARENEPRDFDLSRAPVRDLRRSTYHHLGTSHGPSRSRPMVEPWGREVNCSPHAPSTNPKQLPIESTYAEHFKEKTILINKPSMLEEGESELERDARHSKHDSVVIPRHNSAQYPHHYTTTHKADYKSEAKFGEARAVPVTVDHSAALKRCLSQFTDSANHRRLGRNTWQDESGIYSNGILKSACPYYARTYTLMPGGVRPDTAC